MSETIEVTMEEAEGYTWLNLTDNSWKYEVGYEIGDVNNSGIFAILAEYLNELEEDNDA